MKRIMNRYPVDPNTTITFTAKADDNVAVYGARLLFIDKDGNEHEQAQWSADQLKSGAKFEFKATGEEEYEIDLGAELIAAAVIKTTTAFSQHPPKDDTDSVALDPSEPGDIVRFWQFAP